MQASPLFALPLETRRDIFSYCKNRDLINLSACSKRCHEEVTPLVWNKVELNLKDKEKKAVYAHKYLRHLKHTSQLTFIGDSRCERNGWYGFIFGTILQNCSPERLMSLYISAFHEVDAVKLASEIVPNIERLSLSSMQASVPDSMWHFEHLRFLSLSSCNISDDHIKKISEQGKLVKLKMQCCWNLTPLSLEYVSRLTGLTEFTFVPIVCYDKKNGAQFSAKLKIALKKMISCVALDLSFCTNKVVNDVFFENAATDLKYVEYLRLRDTKIGDIGVHSISSTLHLKYLSLPKTSITDKAFVYISKLTSLRYLDVNNCMSVTLNGLLHIANLKDLHHLNFGRSKIDMKVKSLKILLENLIELRYINMSGVKGVTDGCVRVVVSQLHRLEALGISGSKITDQGLKQLKNLKHLKYLSAYVYPGDPTRFEEYQDLCEYTTIDPFMKARCFEY